MTNDDRQWAGWAGRPAQRAETRSGHTLLEALIAVVVLSIVVFGAAAFMQAGAVVVDKAQVLRTATQVAQDRLEQAKALAYASIVNASGTATVSGQTYSWTITVTTAQADPGDAASTYKIIHCNVTHAGTGQSVAVRSAVAP
jgi:Tfp pilus assembly protein PilV